MGLWFWKPGETVDPQQALSEQLGGQGDPGEGWSQSRSATPASLADSFGGSGVCSFEAPNRMGGMPDLLFGADVQLYGSWSQVGKVTSVETDGDYSSYNVDDVLARFNKQVKVGPLAAGYRSRIFWRGTEEIPGTPDYDATVVSTSVAEGPGGGILSGLWETAPGGLEKRDGRAPGSYWPLSQGPYIMASSRAVDADNIYMVMRNAQYHINWFSYSSATFIRRLDVSTLDGWPQPDYRIWALGAYRDDYVFVAPERNIIETSGRIFRVDTSSWDAGGEIYFEWDYTDLPGANSTWPINQVGVAVDEDNGRVAVSFRYNAGINNARVCAIEYSLDGEKLATHYTDIPPAGQYVAVTGMLGTQYASNGDVITSFGQQPTATWAELGRQTRRWFINVTRNTSSYMTVRDEGDPYSVGTYGTDASRYAGQQFALHHGLDDLAIIPVNQQQDSGNIATGYYFMLLDKPTLRQAYFFYMLEAGVPLDISIDNAQVFDEEVSYPDWEGNLLDKLVELAAVTRTQFSPGALPGSVDVEALGGTIHEQLPQAMGGKPSLSLGTGQAVDSYTVVSQQARVVTPDSPEIVWDARVENELIEFGLSEVKKVTLETPHSLASVVMPIRGLGPGEYAVADSEGENITDAFEDAGGYVRATVNPDNPRAIDVEVFSGRGSIGANRPYSLGYRQTTNGQVIPRFSILGSGIFLNPQEATIWTGADPSFTTGGNGPRYESEFISSWNDAYSAANKISSMSVTPSMDVSLSVPDGVERGTGNVGDRFEHNHGVWRLTSVTTDAATAQWQLQPSTTVGDHDERWAGAKVSDHDSFWDGRTVQDVRVRPLWSDWEPYPGEPIFLKLDDDATPYWALDPPPEAWVMVDSEDGPYWTPQNGPGTKVIKLDTDGKPYYIDEGEG